MAAGGLIGYGRARKRRSAGMRTYMLTCTGAALTMLIALYEREMLYDGQWAWAASFADIKFDASRFSAQVINGVGFLAAGTILSAAHHQVSGLTTAIGLFVTAGIGIAAAEEVIGVGLHNHINGTIALKINFAVSQAPFIQMFFKSVSTALNISEIQIHVDKPVVNGILHEVVISAVRIIEIFMSGGFGQFDFSF